MKMNCPNCNKKMVEHCKLVLSDKFPIWYCIPCKESFELVASSLINKVVDRSDSR